MSNYYCDCQGKGTTMHPVQTKQGDRCVHCGYTAVYSKKPLGAESMVSVVDKFDAKKSSDVSYNVSCGKYGWLNRESTIL